MPKQTFFRLRREKQARIEHAAMEEFTNYSFQDSNVNRIIKGAEIPPGSFYQYFEDKKDLFFYLLEKEMVLWEKGLANQRIQAMYRDVETMKNNHRLMQDYMRPEGLRLFKMLSLAPDWVRRDWVFSVLITRHRGNLYSLAAPPEAAEGNPLLARHEDFFVAFFLSLTVLLETYTHTEESIVNYYGLLTSIFWNGLSHPFTEECSLMNQMEDISRKPDVVPPL